MKVSPSGSLIHGTGCLYNGESFRKKGTLRLSQERRLAIKIKIKIYALVCQNQTINLLFFVFLLPSSPFPASSSLSAICQILFVARVSHKLTRHAAGEEEGKKERRSGGASLQSRTLCMCVCV